MLNLKKISLTSAIIASISLLAACGLDDNGNTTTIIPDDNVSEGAESCFWAGPYVIDNPNSNIAYIDTGAAYWTAKYTLPEDSSLKLNGEFPFARYTSFNSYRSDSTPAFALRDQQIKASVGSTNPFIQGSQRNSDNRSYQIELASGEAPIIPLDNTVYDYTQPNSESTLWYRVYVPDKGNDVTGGVGLPTPELTLSSGEVLTGQAVCDTLKSDPKLLKSPLIPDETYAFLRQNNPARENPIWRAVYNIEAVLKCDFLGQCEGNPERKVGWFANLDNQYVGMYLDRAIKPVAVIRGKIPKVTSTLNGNEVFDESDSQVRYWSMCQNEYYSQKVTACLYDEQVTINPDGYFTIVTSLTSDRPNNANDECGIGYLPWSPEGDGFSIIPGRKNNETDALLLMRNMLPASDFDNAIQNTSVPGDEASVMGEFLPTVQYFTKVEFESLGCNAYASLPQ